MSTAENDHHLRLEQKEITARDLTLLHNSSLRTVRTVLPDHMHV